MASTIFLAASFKSEADKIFSLDLSNISLPCSKFVPANLTTREQINSFPSQHQPRLELKHHNA